MTSFNEIYEVYLNRVVDRGLAKLIEEEDRYKDLQLKLQMAIARFTDLKDIEVDFDARTITKTTSDNGKLSLVEIDILVCWMIVEWATPLVLNENAIKERLTSTDYALYSPANMLNQMRNLLTESERRADRLSVKYGYLKNSKYGKNKW